MNSNITDPGTPAASDGLDMQQRAMGSAGQVAALLDEPYRGDAQQIAMGSAGQSLLAAVRRDVGGYVSGATAGAAQPGGYVSSDTARLVIANSYVNAAPAVVGAYVTTSAV
ncbi:hypothetical protein ASC66_05440 [Leifsonia sp. Root4]|uniref:hypothetical protein n=1 Tax=Leifsonia sp. Root4 TaxID=1736525 RepID=UPI0006FE8514|nr:hypothetical protein [Leifsonia sp. Root4]KQW08349.1 hypothetical protein ASC66_05440 [Leifsonia sp. Root4]